MASRSLGTLTLDLVAKTGGYVAGLDKAERNTKKWRNNTKKELVAVGKSFALLSAGIASGLAAATIATVSRTKELIDAQAKFADSVGISTESLAGLEHAASINGATNENLRKGLERLIVNVNDFKKGVGEAVPAFERLGISLKDIENLSPDEMFALIGDKLNEIPDQSERAALSYDIFGRSGIKLVKTLEQGTEGLRDFKEEAEKLGLTLSRIDALQVEEANDALTRAGAVGKGFANQLTVELAPAIQAVAELYLDAALKAEGFGSTASLVGDLAVAAVGGIGDGWENLNLIILKNRERLTEILGLTLKIAAYNPGSLVIDPFGNLFRNKLKESAEILSDLGDTYGKEFDDAIANRIENGTFSDRLKDKIEENRKNLEELEKDAETKTGGNNPRLSIVPDEKVIKKDNTLDKLNDEATRIRDSLRTEEEAIEESYIRRRDIILANTKYTGEAQNELLTRLADERASQLENTTLKREQQAKLDALERDVAAISDSMRTEEEIIADSYEKRKETILSYVRETGIAQTELLKELEEDRNTQLEQLEGKRRIVALQNQELLFGGIASLAKEFAGEESGIYKAAFAIEKAAAIARAIVAIQTGIAQASAIPFPQNIAAIASVASATAGIISTIRGTTIEGQAHDGLDSVPKTGTYLLEKGERVTTEKTSAKLDKTLDRIKSGPSGGNGVSIGQMVFPGVSNEREARIAGGAAARKINQVLSNSRRYG